MTTSRLSSLFVAAMLSLGAVAPAVAKAPPTQEEVRALWLNEDYKGLVKAMNELAKAQPEAPGPQVQLGLAYLRLEKFDKAQEAFLAAEALGAPVTLSQYNLACARALAGDVDGGFEALNKAIAAGFSDVGLLGEDTDIASLRADKRFAATLAQADRNARPCELDARYSGLDFWVGEWVVTDAKGFVVGKNAISRDLTGCTIIEQWSPAYGQPERSMTVFDASTQTWRQICVNSGGEVISYEGAAKDGVVILEGEVVGHDGAQSLSRMTLTPNADGTVKQTISRSTDGGQSWTHGFVGTYTRTAEQMKGE